MISCHAYLSDSDFLGSLTESGCHGKEAAAIPLSCEIIVVFKWAQANYRKDRQWSIIKVVTRLVGGQLILLNELTTMLHLNQSRFHLKCVLHHCRSTLWGHVYPMEPQKRSGIRLFTQDVHTAHVWDIAHHLTVSCCQFTRLISLASFSPSDSAMGDERSGEAVRKERQRRERERDRLKYFCFLLEGE